MVAPERWSTPLMFEDVFVKPIDHHGWTHNQKNAEVLGDLEKLDHFHMRQFARISAKMDAIQEGERTALDNSMLMLCSSMMTGHHDASQLPVVMLGRAGGQIQGGQNLDYSGQSDRQMCRLYLSMMDKMGIKLGQFGDATQRLDEV